MGDVAKTIAAHPPDLRAYELYLKGRYFWSRRSEAALLKAVDYFQQAAAIDSTHAPTYAGLADTHILLGIFFRSPREEFPRATRAALSAVALDSMSAEAYTSLAHVRAVIDRDFAGADSLYRKAIALDPRYPTAHQYYAVYLSAVGRARDAVREIEIARELDPLSYAIASTFAAVCFWTHRYEEGARMFAFTAEMDSTNVHTPYWPALSLIELGRTDEAIGLLTRGLRYSPNSVRLLGALSFAYARAGREVDALREARALRAVAEMAWTAPLDVAAAQLTIGDTAAALAVLEQARREGSHWLVFLRADARFDGLRAHPRFVQLMKRTGLLGGME
ncbi:MAG: tetratricopeptide repeat protein [Gemmatimonadota bacterium]